MPAAPAPLENALPAEEWPANAQNMVLLPQLIPSGAAKALRTPEVKAGMKGV